VCAMAFVEPNWGGALVPWELIQLPEWELEPPTAEHFNYPPVRTSSAASPWGGTLRRLERKGFRYCRQHYVATPTPTPSPAALKNRVEDFTESRASLSFRLVGQTFLRRNLVVAVLCLPGP